MTIFINRKLWKQIGIKSGWLDPSIKTAQANDEMLVDMGSTTISLPSNIRRSINTKLNNLGNYHKVIPLEAINSILEQNNCILLQEDGTKWSGFVAPTGYCGETDQSGRSKNSPMKFELAYKKDGKYFLVENSLWMSACKMPSEKIEIVAYIS